MKLSRVFPIALAALVSAVIAGATPKKPAKGVDYSDKPSPDAGVSQLSNQAVFWLHGELEIPRDCDTLIFVASKDRKVFSKRGFYTTHAENRDGQRWVTGREEEIVMADGASRRLTGDRVSDVSVFTYTDKAQKVIRRKIKETISHYEYTHPDGRVESFERPEGAADPTAKLAHPDSRDIGLHNYYFCEAQLGEVKPQRRAIPDGDLIRIGEVVPNEMLVPIPAPGHEVLAQMNCWLPDGVPAEGFTVKDLEEILGKSTVEPGAPRFEIFAAPPLPTKVKPGAKLANSPAFKSLGGGPKP